MTSQLIVDAFVGCGIEELQRTLWAYNVCLNTKGVPLSELTQESARRVIHTVHVLLHDKGVEFSWLF